jgi:hypothetical protein
MMYYCMNFTEVQNMLGEIICAPIILLQNFNVVAGGVFRPASYLAFFRVELFNCWLKCW